MSDTSKIRVLRAVAVVCAILAVGVAVSLVLQRGDDALVVYCAHDEVYARAVLRDFEEETGIRVATRFDSEAGKSLGLVQQILQEKNAPRCDVFWNNQLMGTLDLVEAGVLEPYKGPSWQRIPSRFRDAGGRWVGFGARLRVYIVNTENMAATEDAVAARLAGGDLSRFAVAKPLFGTTRTHYTVLWHLWGGEKLKAWHADRLKRGMQCDGGNATVKNLVAGGSCDLGLTDTDDFFVARDAGRPVGMAPFRLPDGRTVCIPNTVCIVKGTRRLTKARVLANYLASAACELRLARSKARQIPLGPVDPEALDEDVRQLAAWAADAYPLHRIQEARQACLAWLKSEYAP